MSNQEQINKEYINTQFKIDKQIEILKDKLAKHNETEHLDWGHVGDMKYILSQLIELNEEG